MARHASPANPRVLNIETPFLWAKLYITPNLRGKWVHVLVLLMMPTETKHERRYVRVKRVDECESLDEVFTHCLPAFGGAYLRRIYQILDNAVGAGCPMTLAVSGPVTVSGQHQTWLLPLLETGWVAYLSTTDAVCYHDGHRSLDAYKSGPVHEVPIFTDDGALREEGTIRVTDMAFDEGVLLDQDRFLSAVLARPEF